MQSHKQREREKKSVHKHPPQYFSTFIASIDQSTIVLLMPMIRHTYIYMFPSILEMKRFSIVYLQEAYFKIPSSVPNACFPYAARRISMAKRKNIHANALCLVR